MYSVLDKLILHSLLLNKVIGFLIFMTDLVFITCRPEFYLKKRAYSDHYVWSFRHCFCYAAVKELDRPSIHFL